MVSVVGYKVISLFIVLTAGMSGGLLPLRFRLQQRLLALGNSFAGGIFLTAGLVHMLGEAAEDMEAYFDATGQSESAGADFPWTYCLSVLGIFITIFFDRMVVSHGSESVEEAAAESMKYANGAEQEPARAVIRSAMAAREPSAATTNPEAVAADSKTPLLDAEAYMRRADAEARRRAEILPYILIIVLSIHSFIAGMALGIEDDVGHAIAIFIAIAAHKWFAAFALGVSLVKAGTPTFRLVRQVGIFSTMTPIGIMIGILLDLVLKGTAASLLVSAIIQSIAAGTFIFVALVEVVMEELEKEEDKRTKFGMIFLGYIVMSIVAIWT